jgi:hypothetical protein
MGGCRKLHTEELHDLYSSPSIIRMMSLGDEVGRAYSMLSIYVTGRKARRKESRCV